MGVTSVFTSGRADFSAITGDTAAPFMGMQIYSVQHTTLLRAATIFVMGVVLLKYWRAFTPDEDIARFEHRADAKERGRRA